MVLSIFRKKIILMKKMMVMMIKKLQIKSIC